MVDDGEEFKRRRAIYTVRRITAKVDRLPPARREHIALTIEAFAVATPEQAQALAALLAARPYDIAATEAYVRHTFPDLATYPFTPEELAEMRADVANGAGHDCGEWNEQGRCLLCDEQKTSE